ncbi:DUF2207 family protein [Phytohabitans kaempferiae]|uniref:DUF2207 family protein n=1 Tax=Phytohabitans kaempferiae TaxID=1620943 RepID=A0ABV6LYV0_9ACTN
MDDRALLDLAIGGLAVAGWLLAYGLARLVTRPASPPPDPATPDLGAEPPAVVSLLVNRWQVTEDAAESTLLDLAARRFLELRQPAADPMRTTVHLPSTAPDESGLRPYERRVLSRIRGLAVGGVVPLSALTFRDEGRAKSWNKRLRAEVVADARAAGLSRRRFGPGVTAVLVTLAVLAALGTGAAAFHYALWSDSEDNAAFPVALVTFMVLTGIAGLSPGERDTPLGRQVAARWLGVRAWLRGHEQFAELPPASVTVWDRYLAYGAAVGATRLTSAVLDLGMGNRALVWSSFGGTWHRVRVRYPRFWPRYGRPLSNLLVRSLVCLAIGAALVWLLPGGLDSLADIDGTGRRAPDPVGDGIFAVGALLLLFGLYLLVRALADLATERTITGEVLWLEVWNSSSQGNDSPPRPWLHYLAVDDGTADRTTAWGLPSEWASRCQDGDTVTIRVRPWSRRIVDLTVVGHGRSRQLTEPATGDLGPTPPTGAPGPVPATPRAPVTVELLTVEEVTRALGQPVRTGDAMALGGVIGGTQYLSAERGRPLLLVQTVTGAPARWAWRANSRGQELPGIGDGAYASGDRAALRLGDTTLVLTLLGEARGRHTYLPWLLAQCATRLGTERRV